MPDPTITTQLNVAEVLRVIMQILPQDRFGDNDNEAKYEKIVGLTKYLLGDHTPDDSALDELRTQISALKESMRDLTTWRQDVMATLQQFKDAFAKIDAATNDIAADLKGLRDRIAELEANQGISAADEDSMLAEVDGLVTKLEGTAKDPENPVPPTEPTEPTEPAEPTEPTEPEQPTNPDGEPTGPGSAGTPPDVTDGTNQTPNGNPPVVAVDPDNDDGTGVSEPQRGTRTRR